MRRYFHPLPLPDLQGLEPEWVGDRIHLSLNWLDVFDDAPSANEGEIAVEVCHQDLRIGYLRRDVECLLLRSTGWYCDLPTLIGWHCIWFILTIYTKFLMRW